MFRFNLSTGYDLFVLKLRFNSNQPTLVLRVDVFILVLKFTVMLLSHDLELRCFGSVSIATIVTDQTICHVDEDKDGKDEKADTDAGGSGTDMMNGSAAKQRKLDSASSSDDDDDDGAGGRKMSKASTKSGKSLSAKKKSSKPVASKVYSK